MSPHGAPLAAAVFGVASMACFVLVARSWQWHALLSRIGVASPAARPLRGWRARRRLPGVAMVVGGGGFGLLLAGFVGAVAGAMAGAAVPTAVRRRRHQANDRRLEIQLIDAVVAIAAALRAGLSLRQAIEEAAAESEPPLRPLLLDVVSMQDLGGGLDGALERWSATATSPDIRLVADVLRLHHRMGGDAPSVLDEVGRSLRHRRAIRLELSSLTAQARLSGLILGLLPIGFFAFLALVSRSDVQVALASGLGRTAVVVGLLLEVFAFAWIRRLLRIDVG